METIPEVFNIVRTGHVCIATSAPLRSPQRRRYASPCSAWVAVLVGTLVLSSSALATDQTQSRAVLEQFLNELTTFQATFEQQLFDEYGELLETANGDVAISKPGKFRWEYRQPYSQLIVTDGVTLWVYDVDLEQVSINPFSQGGPGSPAALLVGEVDLDRHYVTTDLLSDDNINWVSLTPRESDGQYSAIEIGLNDDGIQAMKLRDNLNQRTDIQFNDIRRNVEITMEHFSFVPPPGVDIMQGPGH